MGFEILAAIDLHGGRVVRLVQGDFERATVHGDDPAAVARDLLGAGAQRLHVVDLDGARAGWPVHVAAIEAIATAAGDPNRVEVGGGIRDEATARGWLDRGVGRVVLGSAALRDPELCGRLVRRHGSAAVAVAIDVRAGRATGDAWQAGAEGVDPAAAVGRLASVGVRAFEVTAVERDGTLEGPDLALLGRFVDLGVGSIVASGGIRSIADLEAVRDAGCVGAIVGRALYEGRLDLRAAVAALA